MYKYFSLILFLCIQLIYAQDNIKIKGQILKDEIPLKNITITNDDNKLLSVSDLNGFFEFDWNDSSSNIIYFYQSNRLVHQEILSVALYFDQIWIVTVESKTNDLDEIVISGTMRAVSKIESPVPVEVLRASFFKKNPTSNIFEALQNVNGVRPQINCNVCNTGDIHINGLEGPYTMVLIDGMPIVSGLSTVYGLSGIPTSLIDRVEIVKGPASSLYGSEAVGGLINIITKNPFKASRFSVDLNSNTWRETNLDLGFKSDVSSKSTVLVGLNYFNYSNPIDNNQDNFTDLTLQERISVFQKWQFERENNRLFSVAARYFYEDRWGGEMQWNKNFRGTDLIYGESIYTKRFEILSNYQLPTREPIFINLSYTDHHQNSVYGDTFFMAHQQIGFLQSTWNIDFKKHKMLLGSAVRFNSYNDNTVAITKTDRKFIPSFFIQDEILFNTNNTLLTGLRWDYHQNHGSILTPRLAYRLKLSETDILRLNLGTGFRVVNLFTEEHAALTGSRDVVVLENLKPEQSFNINLNYLKKMPLSNHNFFSVETSAWYTHFSNSIMPDYLTDPNKIIYKNLDGYAVTQGLSANIDFDFNQTLSINTGITWMDVYKVENNVKSTPLLSEKFMGTWNISYTAKKLYTTIDYTGNIYGPMRLPLLGPLDPRPEYSPVWSIQNIQLSFKKWQGIDIYLGVKNFLNWTPSKGNPFLIARSHDPFDKNVVFDNQQQPIQTLENPYALTFDPSYVFAPNQGIRIFVGFRYQIY